MERSNIATAKPFTRPDPPLNILFDEIDEGVTIEWEPPEDTGRYPIEDYSIHRGHSKDDLSIVQVMDDPALVFNDINLTAGEKYFYRISAVNKLGSSHLSSPRGVVSPLSASMIAA